MKMKAALWLCYLHKMVAWSYPPTQGQRQYPAQRSTRVPYAFVALHTSTAEQAQKHNAFCHTLSRRLTEVLWHHFNTYRKAGWKPPSLLWFEILAQNQQD